MNAYDALTKIRKFHIWDTSEGPEVRAHPDGAYVLYADILALRDSLPQEPAIAAEQVAVNRNGDSGLTGSAPVSAAPQEPAEPTDEQWLDAQEAFEAIAPGQRGHAEWCDRMRAAMAVLHVYPLHPPHGSHLTEKMDPALLRRTVEEWHVGWITRENEIACLRARVKELEAEPQHGGRPMTLREVMESEEPAEPQGARAVAEKIDRALSEAANGVKHGEQYYLHGLWKAREIVAQVAAYLSEPAPQERAKVPEGLPDALRSASAYLLSHGKHTLAGDCIVCADVIQELAAPSPEPQVPWTGPDDATRAMVAKAIDECPLIASLLYDIDLLPEQIKDARRYGYMLAVIGHVGHVLFDKERAKVPDGWKLVCEKCGADRP